MNSSNKAIREQEGNMKYRKKPVVIEAIQYRREENIASCLNFCDKMIYNPETNEYEIETLEGNHLVSEGDYIIKGVKGEYYPCKPDIFEQTYELVGDSIQEIDVTGRTRTMVTPDLEIKEQLTLEEMLIKYNKEEL